MNLDRSAGAGFRQPQKRRASGLRRVVDVLLAFAILALLALVSTRLDRFNAVTSAGVARVADGDSLSLGGERIRLWGIDAPELSQTCRRQGQDYPCGRLARDALRRLTEGRQISCEGWQRDRYQRLLADCSASGVDLSASQVAAGWAVAYGGYLLEEARARNAGLGLWQGEFERPSDWRALHGDIVESEHDWLGTVGNWLRQLFGRDKCHGGEEVCA